MLKNYFMIALVFLVVSPTCAMNKEEKTKHYLDMLSRTFLACYNFSDDNLLKAQKRYRDLTTQKRIVIIIRDDTKNKPLKRLSEVDCRETKKAMKSAQLYKNAFNQIYCIGALATIGMGIMYFCNYDKVDQRKFIRFIAAMGIASFFCDLTRSFYNKKEATLKRTLIRKKDIRDTLRSDVLESISLYF